MRELDLFLKALKKRLKIEQGKFIQRAVTVPNERFPAIKNKTLEVWFVINDYQQCICKSSVEARITNPEETKAVDESLLVDIYEKLLKFYGV